MHDLATIVAMNAEKTTVNKTPYDLKAELIEADADKARSYDFGGSSDLRVHNHNNEKPKADLYNWMITGRTGSDQLNPLNGFMLAYGRIANDERRRWPDGAEVCTSVIVKVDTKAMQIETLNTIYNLK